MIESSCEIDIDVKQEVIEDNSEVLDVYSFSRSTRVKKQYQTRFNLRLIKKDINEYLAAKKMSRETFAEDHLNIDVDLFNKFLSSKGRYCELSNFVKKMVIKIAFYLLNEGTGVNQLKYSLLSTRLSLIRIFLELLLVKQETTFEFATNVLNSSEDSLSAFLNASSEANLIICSKTKANFATIWQWIQETLAKKHGSRRYSPMDDDGKLINIST